MTITNSDLAGRLHAMTSVLAGKCPQHGTLLASSTDGSPGWCAACQSWWVFDQQRYTIAQTIPVPETPLHEMLRNRRNRLAGYLQYPGSVEDGQTVHLAWPYTADQALCGTFLPDSSGDGYPHDCAECQAAADDIVLLPPPEVLVRLRLDADGNPPPPEPVAHVPAFQEEQN